MSQDIRFIPSYSRVSQFIREYGIHPTEDKHSALDYREFEATEAITALKSELNAVINGNFNEDSINRIIGKARKQIYGSYQDWARLMLQWLRQA